MKKWIIFFTSFLLALAVILTITIIWNANASFSNAKSRAERIALQSDFLDTIEKSSVYNGTKSYIAVYGNDEDDKEKIVFIPTDKKDSKAPSVFLKDIISEEEAKQIVVKKYPTAEIIHVKLGYEQPGVIWEVTFKEHNGKWNYVYLIGEDGDWWKNILNL